MQPPLTCQLVAVLGADFTAALVRRLGPGATAGLVAEMGPALTAALVLGFGPQMSAGEAGRGCCWRVLLRQVRPLSSCCGWRGGAACAGLLGCRSSSHARKAATTSELATGYGRGWV
jgi:hypothetical protein